MIEIHYTRPAIAEEPNFPTDRVFTRQNPFESKMALIIRIRLVAETEAQPLIGI